MTIFFDFNGTIIDDLQLSFDLLNEMLIEEGHPTIDLDTYLNIFTFPIKSYYEKAGFNFKKNSFEQLAVRYIERYQPQSLKLKLHEGLIDTVKRMHALGHTTVVLSASKKSNLMEQLQYFNINNLFDDILGIEDIYASSKIDIAKTYVQTKGLNTNQVVMVGDTLHDAEVAQALGCAIIMYSKGHQAYHRFGDLKTIHHFNELEKEIEKL